MKLGNCSIRLAAHGYWKCRGIIKLDASIECGGDMVGETTLYITLSWDALMYNKLHRYVHGFLVIHLPQGYSTGTGAIMWLPQCHEVTLNIIGKIKYCQTIAKTQQCMTYVYISWDLLCVYKLLLSSMSTHHAVRTLYNLDIFSSKMQVNFHNTDSGAWLTNQGRVRHICVQSHRWLTQSQSQIKFTAIWNVRQYK